MPNRTITRIALSCAFATVFAVAGLAAAGCSTQTASTDAQTPAAATAPAPAPANAQDPAGAGAVPPATQQAPVAQAPAQTTPPSGTSPSASKAAAAQARQLVEQKCGTGCHPVSAVLNNKTKDPQVWDAIFTNMQQRGVQVTPQQKQVMIDYLLNR